MRTDCSDSYMEGMIRVGHSGIIAMIQDRHVKAPEQEKQC